MWIEFIKIVYWFRRSFWNSWRMKSLFKKKIHISVGTKNKCIYSEFYHFHFRLTLFQNSFLLIFSDNMLSHSSNSAFFIWGNPETFHKNRSKNFALNLLEIFAVILLSLKVPSVEPNIASSSNFDEPLTNFFPLFDKISEKFFGSEFFFSNQNCFSIQTFQLTFIFQS